MRTGWAVGFDVLAVLVFVGVGRASHEEALSLVGFLGTAWPFLAGLGAGWWGVRAWRRPEVLVPSGLVIWVSTVVVGLLLRIVSGDGAAGAFVVVATLFLATVLLGWRSVAMLVRRPRTS